MEIALQLLSRVETLHNVGYIHGDIQLKHVCLSHKKINGQNIVYLIDFTSSQKVIVQTVERKALKAMTIDDFEDQVPFDA